jgi:GT2 family glycosyltransferase
VRVKSKMLNSPKTEFKFTIIIPVKEINDYVRETVPYIQNLKGGVWELLIIPNSPTDSLWVHDKRIKVVPSGRVGPADKRDLGARLAKHNVLLFLDDDSYPDQNLILEISRALCLENTCAVGGPAVTPKQNNLWQKTSGAVYESVILGSDPIRYLPIGKSRIVNDWPSVNLAVMKDDFISVGGFDSKFWPGEDTDLCRKLTNSGKLIRYVPEAIVYHHRRASIKLHLKQAGSYGRHRGLFFKIKPENSRKIKYLVPSFFTLTVLFLPAGAHFSNKLNLIWLFELATYTIAVLIGSAQTFRRHGFMVGLLFIPYVFLTHLSYGLNFLRGLFTKKSYQSKLR